MTEILPSIRYVFNYNNNNTDSVRIATQSAILNGKNCVSAFTLCCPHTLNTNNTIDKGLHKLCFFAKCAQIT